MTKTSIKLKFRSSSVADREGTIYFQIIHDRKVRQLATSSERIRNDLERLNRIVADFDRKGLPFEADDIITEYHRIISEHTLFTFMEGVIAQLKQMGKTRTAETYRATLNSFKKFRNGEDIMLDEVTSAMLEQYQAWLIAKGVVPNTISFYMKKLRATYNKAVNDELITDRRPFRRVFTGIEKTQKRALPSVNISKLKRADLSNKPKAKFARDMFVLSFYLRGMSYVDMTFLKKSDLKDGMITYRRHKTNQQISIAWTKEMQQILDDYPHNPSQYLLPIITSNTSDLHKTYVNVGQRINYHLKKLAKSLDINANLTMYCSRHSWATIARDKGIPISVISEGLGHDNERTTEIYLASLNQSKVDKANDLIIKAI